jgi:hypothetical protein
LELGFYGTNVTIHVGLPAFRELDGALGLTSKIGSGLRDKRTNKNTRHFITTLLRQPIKILLAKWLLRLNGMRASCLQEPASL